MKVVDLREEILSGNKSMISRELHNEIETNLKNKKQTNQIIPKTKWLQLHKTELKKLKKMVSP